MLFSKIEHTLESIKELFCSDPDERASAGLTPSAVAESLVTPCGEISETSAKLSQMSLNCLKTWCFRE